MTVTKTETSIINPLLLFSLALILIEAVIIILAETLFLKLGLLTVGLAAALIEMFYENAGVKQGSWEFHDSPLKIGQLSIEFVPIASCGTVISRNISSLAMEPSFWRKGVSSRS